MSDETWNLPSRKESGRKLPEEAASACSVQSEQTASTKRKARGIAADRLCVTDLPSSLPILTEEIALLEMWVGDALANLFEE